MKGMKGRVKGVRLPEIEVRRTRRKGGDSRETERRTGAGRQVGRWPAARALVRPTGDLPGGTGRRTAVIST